jgi:hypothetical protein
VKPKITGMFTYESDITYVSPRISSCYMKEKAQKNSKLYQYIVEKTTDAQVE